jgi:hypothetical protein
MREVCERIGEGETVLEVAFSLAVSPKLVYRWGAQPEYRDTYTRARIYQAHALAERALKIARTPTDSLVEVARMRVEVDTIKWFTSKIAPKLYGDKLHIEHTVDVSKLTDEQLELLAQGKPYQALPSTTE